MSDGTVVKDKALEKTQEQEDEVTGSKEVSPSDYAGWVDVEIDLRSTIEAEWTIVQSSKHAIHPAVTFTAA